MKFNSDDDYIFYCGKNPLEEKEGLVALITNKIVWNAILGCSFKNESMISVHFQGKPLNITVIQIYTPTTNDEEAEVEPSYEDLQDLLKLNTKRRCPFHKRGLECKSRKLRDTWRNRQVWPWSTEWSRAKVNRFLPRENTGHGKHPLPRTQEKTLHMDITRWSTPIRLIIFFAAKDGEPLYTQQKQDWELIVAQIMNSLLPNSDLKKVGKGKH